MDSNTSVDELHWMLGILQNVDVGLVVLNRDSEICLWNGFMDNHSGINPGQAIGKNFFSLFPEVDEPWLKRKLDSVFLLNNRSFSTWQQRPYLLKFDSYRPITGESEWMYQNLTIIPLASVTGKVEQVCLILYDVTDVALDEIALQKANEKLDLLGRTDGLTGLFNRRAWEEYLNTEFQRFKRSGHSSCLVMFDIDHFKKVNDTYGHQAGDEVICEVATLLQEVKRTTDCAGRYGGEEFAVILPDTELEGAQVFAERMRASVEGRAVVHDGQTIQFTISLGIAMLQYGDNNGLEALERADKALYQSKEGGRNQVTTYDEAS